MNSASSDIAATLAGFFSEVPATVVSAYLFGSQASGRAHRQSDVDLGVLLDWKAHPTRQQRFEERLRLSGQVGGALRRNEIDVVILNDAPPLLARGIVMTGRRVFCSDSEADRAFVRDVQLRAADLAPFLRRARRVKLAAIAR